MCTENTLLVIFGKIECLVKLSRFSLLFLVQIALVHFWGESYGKDKGKYSFCGRRQILPALIQKLAQSHMLYFMEFETLVLDDMLMANLTLSIYCQIDRPNLV